MNDTTGFPQPPAARAFAFRDVYVRVVTILAGLMLGGVSGLVVGIVTGLIPFAIDC